MKTLLKVILGIVIGLITAGVFIYQGCIKPLVGM